jgi:hypothetical protein
MKYVLGNMLGAAGSLNPDGLSLDLQFAADKTLTARKGPTPVFTRASTATFVGSDGLIQSAAVNAPRFDHDPLTLACKGLLIEEARTNLMTQSEQWSGTFSGPLAPTITADTTTAPDGLLSADTLSGSTGTAPDGGLNSAFRTITVSSSTTHTFSIYVKSLGVATQAEIRIRDNSTGVSGQTLDTSLTSSWKRISVTLTTGAATTSVRCIIQNTNGDIAIWGAQLEAGSFPTSYIPTTTAALTRSADVCSITGSDFSGVYNQAEHSLFVEALAMSHSNFGSYLSFDNGTASDQSAIAGFPGPNTVNCYVIDNGVAQAQVSRAVTLNQNNKIAATMKQDSFQVALNGILGVEDTAGTMPTANILKIGRSWSSNTISGTYKQIKIYKKRLANAKLQSLTS